MLCWAEMLSAWDTMIAELNYGAIASWQDTAEITRAMIMSDASTSVFKTERIVSSQWQFFGTYISL